jgi:hypothetical protein
VPVVTVRRWVGLGLLLALLAVLALVVLDDERPPVKVPPLLRFDAGVVVRAAATSALSRGGQTFPSAVVTPTLGRACVRGRVVDGWTRAGVGGATVSASTFGGVMTTTADDAGAFELVAPAEGSVSLVEVAAPGFVPFRPENDDAPIEVWLVDGVCATDLVLTLQPVVTLEGLVVDEGDAPVADAGVARGSETEPPKLVGRSDAAGRFSVEGRTGERLLISHAAFEPAVVPVDERLLVQRALTVRLRRAVDAGVTLVVSGRVVDDRDAGVPGARVQARAELQGLSWLEAEAESDEGGAFALQVDARGPWQVEARRGAKASARVTTSGEAVVLRLSDGARLDGTVKTSDGAAVQSFAVLIRRVVGGVEGVDLPPRHVISPDGRFALAALPVGLVEVVVAAPGLAPSVAERVRLSPGVTATLDVVLVAGATLAGRVVDRLDRRPLSGARVSLERSEVSTVPVQAVVQTDAEGRFRLPGLPPGRHSVLLVAAGYDARLTSVDLPPSGEVGPLEFDLAPVPDGGAPQLELVGIGAVLEAVGDGLIIGSLVPGGGAAEAGLLAGDLVVHIDGARASSLGFAGSIERIRGAEGSQVVLEVQRAGGALERVTVTRRRVVR